MRKEKDGEGSAPIDWERLLLFLCYCLAQTIIVFMAAASFKIGLIAAIGEGFAVSTVAVWAPTWHFNPLWEEERESAPDIIGVIAGSVVGLILARYYSGGVKVGSCELATCIFVLLLMSKCRPVVVEKYTSRR